MILHFIKFLQRVVYTAMTFKPIANRIVLSITTPTSRREEKSNGCFNLWTVFIENVPVAPWSAAISLG